MNEIVLLHVAGAEDDLVEEAEGGYLVPAL